MVKTKTMTDEARMYTMHGRKKNIGKWFKKDGKPVLAFTKGENEEIVGYTTIEEIMHFAYAKDLPEMDTAVDF